MNVSRKSFASDNNSGVHPAILQAIATANEGHAIAYGDDPITARAVEKLREHFGEEIDAYFVYGGTGANVLGLKQIARPHHSIICPETAHIHNDECGAPEHYTGCKLLTVPSNDGKLTVEGVQRHLHGFGFEHHSQPKVISISQATELGTVYTPEEIRALADLAHRHGMLLHMDGARLCNAAAALDAGLREITTGAGVDVLSFGGAKNGLLIGECVIFFRKELSADFKFTRKQGMQLMSKMRFVAAQYEAYLSGDLCLRLAKRANRTAGSLAAEVEKIPEIQITQPVQSNAVFAILPKEAIEELQRQFFFYVWNEETSEVRWMTSFDTNGDDVMDFVQCIRIVMNKYLR
ncbi:MAG: low specificity L-threonine aldolase [Candidatus Omnitrophica bacterium]|nr:low specificity L-threonine aldolase [Candidatus Omnitrophota bacterium]